MVEPARVHWKVADPLAFARTKEGIERLQGSDLAVLSPRGRTVFQAAGQRARELWRKLTRQSPSYPEERAARAERARQARQETRQWDQQHHTPPPGGPPAG